jgi:hypothetical protein
MKIKKIKIPIYHGHLVLIQVKDLCNIPDKWKPKDWDAKGYAGVAYWHDNKHAYRYFIIAVLKDTSFKIVVHEALHCVHYIFEHAGIKVDISNDEHEAYLIEWIVGECHKHFKIKNK